MISGPFAALSPATQAQLTAAARVGHWAKGDTLFHPDDAVEALYLITRGLVRLYRIGSAAKEVTLTVHGAGEMLGMSVLLPDATYGAYGEALDDTEALILGRETLSRLTYGDPAIGVALSEQVARQIRGLQDRMTGMVFLEVSQRLAQVLLDMAEREGPWDGQNPLPLRERISHQDLAHAVGSTRETITKLLGDFRTRGLLDLGYRRLVLTDKAGLEAASLDPLPKP